MATVGDRVRVPHVGCEGTVKFKGEVHYAKGEWFGIELDKPLGKNNGTVKGTKYFTCGDKCGVFARPDAVNYTETQGVKNEQVLGDSGEEDKLQGNIFFGEKRFLKAYECYSRAIEKCESNHVYYGNRAACSLEMGHPEEALEDCEMALEVNPCWVKAYMRKGKALEMMGEVSEAIQTYSEGEALVTDQKSKNELRKLRVKCESSVIVQSEDEGNHDWLQFLPPDMRQEALANPMMMQQLKQMMMEQENDGPSFSMPMETEEEPPKPRLKKPMLVVLPLHEAVKEDRLDELRQLINSADIDELDDHGRSALAWACHLGKSEIVKLLLEHSPLVNPEPVSEDSDIDAAIPLFHGISSGSLQVVEMLLNHGADPLVKEPILGHSIMHQAVKSGNIEMVEYLLNRTSPSIANAEDLRGISAFGLAFKIKMDSLETRVQVIELMFSKGVKVDTSVLLDYLSGRDTELVEYLNKKHLPELDLSPVLTSSTGSNVLHLACSMSPEDLAMKTVKTILNQIDVNLKDNQGRTPLFYACKKGYHPMLALLVSKGAIVDEADNEGNTCLHLVGDNCDENTWNALIKLGANETVLNSEAKAPKLRKNPGENCVVM